MLFLALTAPIYRRTYVIYFLNKRRDVILPKNPPIGSALPIQDINYDPANKLALTCSFRHTVGPYCLCEFSHLE
jgi:hypothetical protein